MITAQAEKLLRYHVANMRCVRLCPAENASQRRFNDDNKYCPQVQVPGVKLAFTDDMFNIALIL